jgi:hypothetical protein
VLVFFTNTQLRISFMRDHYQRYHMPKSIIGYAVRLYYRYKLSIPDISELPLERGIEVTYETIRNWCKTWGPLYAQSIRKKRGSEFNDSSKPETEFMILTQELMYTSFHMLKSLSLRKQKISLAQQMLVNPKKVVNLTQALGIQPSMAKKDKKTLSSRN